MIREYVQLTDIVIDIQQRETGSSLASGLVTELRELADTYGVDGSPYWLLPIFSAVQRGRIISPPVYFERESSDPYSYLFELAMLLNWKFEHPGEYEAIEFPRLGWQIYLCHETYSPTTGAAGSSYEVTPLVAAERTT
jgi:hypothetical protein